QRRLATTVAGVDLALPVLLAPTGALGLSHPAGDLAAARAAETAGTRLVLSSNGSWSIEEVAAGTRATHFFQLYPGSGQTAPLLRRAWRAGVRVALVAGGGAVLGHRRGRAPRGYTRS